MWMLLFLVVTMSFMGSCHPQNEDKNIDKKEYDFEKNLTAIKNNPAIPGAIYVTDVRSKEPEINDKLMRAYVLVQKKQINCIDELRTRMKSKDSDFWDKLYKYQWVSYVSISSKDNIASFAQASVHDSSPWPEYFDDETKKCYLSSFNDVKFETTTEFYYVIMFNNCVSPVDESDLPQK